MTSFACGLLVCSVARAEQSIVIEVSCPGLTSEARSAVEARAYAELMSRHIAAATLQVVCDQDLISAVIAEPGQSARSLSEGASAPEQRVDELVSLVGKLLDAEPLAPEAPGGDEPDDPAAVAPPPPPAPAPAPSPELAPSKASEPAAPPSAPPPRVLPPKKSKADAPTEHALSELPAEVLPPSTLFVGGAFEPWSSEIAGTAGFLGGVTVPLAVGLSARGSANLAFGLGSAQGISLRHLLIEGALEAAITRWSLASLGGGLSSMSFDGGELKAEGKTTSLAPVLTAALRLVPREASPRFSLGPVGRWFGKVRDVNVDDEPVLHTPRWSVALEAEARFGLE